MALTAPQWMFKVFPMLASIQVSAIMPVLEDAGFICSLGWIFYRIWQIYKKPIEELVDLLGLEIPPVPHVSLAGITAESILLYWKPKDTQSIALKHVIQVNGIKVGDFGHADTSIQVTGLKPAHYYNVRVIVTNTADFSTFGPLFRVRTLPSSPDGSKMLLMTNDEFADGIYEEEPASVRAAPSHFDFLLPPIGHQMTREHNACHHNSRRSAATPTNSAVPPSIESLANLTAPAQADGASKRQEDIERLIQRLDSARRDEQEIDKQFQDEDQESQKILKELGQDRDNLKHSLREREETSFELRKHGNYLDKLNRAAQSKKATQERTLTQKHAERKRMNEEIHSWDNEMLEIDRDTEKMLSEKADIIAGNGMALNVVRERIASDQDLMKRIEEEIHLKGGQIKAIGNDMEAAEQVDSEEHLRAKAEKEVDEAWEANTIAAQAHLASLWQVLQQAQSENQRAQEHLAWWNSRRAKDPTQFSPTPPPEIPFPLNANRSRRVRQPNARTSTVNVTSPGSYAPGNLNLHNFTTISPNFALTSPFFNMSNGTAVVSPNEQPGGFLKNQSITDAGPMSPAANDLLPSNLFRDEDIASQRISVAARGHESLSSTNSEMFGGQASNFVEATAYGPITPLSATSQAGSIFSSPHESLQNLHGYQSRTDSFPESDSQSINSTSGSYRPAAAGETSPLAASRIANLFTATFNRQRGKSTSHEPPSLGTLKQAQTRSFPRNIENGSLDSITSRRRRGSYGYWANPVAGLLNRSISASQTPPDERGLTSARTGFGRRSRLNMFGAKLDGSESTVLVDQPNSTSPISNFPFDRGSKRPLSESHRLGWLLPEDTPNQSSSFGAGWSTNGGPWSRGASRRSSLQHGSTSNLSIGSTPLEPEEYQRSLSKHFPEQLPIGTRPRSAQRPVTPKLNPTAPTFKTIFGRGEAKRASKADKHAEKAAEQLADMEAEVPEMEEVNFPHGGSSPAHSRASKDAQSVMTASSLADSRDSLDCSTSGNLSEVIASSGQKQTLMQKIGRKSSSSKFNVAWAKERSGLFSRRGGDPLTSDEINDDTTNESQLRQSADGTINLPQPEKGSRSALSWPNLRRKSKKSASITAEFAEKISDVEDFEEP